MVSAESPFEWISAQERDSDAKIKYCGHYWFKYFSSIQLKISLLGL